MGNESNKVLMIASVASMIKQFNMNNVAILKQMGYKVEIAANFQSGDSMSRESTKKFVHRLQQEKIMFYQIDFARGIGSLSKNMRVLKELKELFKQKQYKFIHTNSPLASVLVRLVARKFKIPVIYTAHGFQFFNGAQSKNWFLYYPIEKILSNITDTLITINYEDYHLAKNKFKMKHLFHIPSVGINYYKYKRMSTSNKSEMKKRFGFRKDDFIVLSVGELSDRKNQSTIISAISKIPNENIKYVMCGLGEKEDELKEEVKKSNLSSRIFFKGYVDNIQDYYALADVFAFPSKREGLGLAGIEAMATGLPLLTSNVNGIMEYSVDGRSGYVYNPQDSEGFAKGINNLYRHPEVVKKMKSYNIVFAQRYDQSEVNQIMREVYAQF